jgi:hypothetical protein
MKVYKLSHEWFVAKDLEEHVQERDFELETTARRLRNVEASGQRVEHVPWK